MRALPFAILLLVPSVALAQPKKPPEKPAATPAKPAATPPATPPAKPPVATPPAAGQPAPAATAPAAGIPAPPAEEEPEPKALDVDALRQEYLALRDQLFRSRARAAAVASAVYSSRMRLHLDYGSGRFYSVTRATVRLDGAGVYDDTGGAIAQDKAPRWTGFVAPGRHVVTVRIEAAGKDDQRFTSAVESSFVVIAPGGKDVIVRCRAEDDGDIAYEWKREEEGSYKLRLDVSVDTEVRANGKAATK
ncbi:MAG TPA: hypothetical protein VMZ28_26820 [Kofleriaceae bacterium]|nr:hypothetical protein [Kofleriaceae bacterium]